MKESLSAILKDLYALDPSLKERDVEVRALITALMDTRPEVPINPTFIRTLHHELTTPARHPHTVTHHSLKWWFVHFAPVGVVAVLSLTLVPQFMHAPTIPLSTPETSTLSVPTTDLTESESFATEATMVAPDVAGDSISSFARTQEMPPIRTKAGSPLEIGVQQTGPFVSIVHTTLTTPSFVVVYRNERTGALHKMGESTLLPSGTTEGILIPLSEPLYAGVPYTVALYVDSDGNGVFASTEDSPYMNPYITDAHVAETFTILE